MKNIQIIDGAVNATAERYAQASVKLAAKGQSIPENHLWIAATALELNMPVATRDGHFTRGSTSWNC
jgi:predicted nucleic acid-binding protein